jgi:general secretion pathway protein D
MRTRTIITALALLASTASFAQFDFGGGASDSAPAWSKFKLNTKTTVNLNFRNANIDLIIQFYQKASGITIVKDPALTGPLTVTSAKAVSLNQAFTILNTTLGLKNFELRKEGDLLVIRGRQQRPEAGAGGGMFGGMTPEQIGQMFSGQQAQLKVYPISYANASQVARVVNEVFAAQQNPFEQIFQQFGGGGGGAAPAFGRPAGGGGGNQGRFGGGGFGGQRTGGFGGFGGGGFGRPGANQTVKASADDFSNSVIVNAPTREQGQVLELIKQIDKQTDQPQQTKVYKLDFAVASEVAPTVQNVLTNNAPTGRGGLGQQNVPIEQRFQQAIRFGGASASFGTVAADSRTNSLVVTATDSNQKLVDEVIKELDKEVKYESSTFVFPLANARADQMASLLQQAFGNRQGTNTGNRGTGIGTQNQQRNNQRQNTGLGGGGGNNLGGGNRLSENAPDPNALSIPLEDPNADAGNLYTMVGVQQGGGFGFFGGGGQQQNRQNQTSQTGRTADGRLVNVRDLTGQVTVIPDQNTNSLVVVSTPENADLIRQILSQLDKIPEQVMIETIIVEASLDSNSKLGVEWSLAQGKVFGDPAKKGVGSQGFGLQGTTGLEGFKYTLTGGDLSAFLSALQTDQKFQVLSTPRIFTSNNAQAEINISQSVPYVLSTREDTNGNLTFNYAFQDVGIVLTVTPRITSNGYVTMEVNQTANDLQGFTSFNAPIVNQRQANTTVSVKDGDTIILGGIIRSQVSSTVKKIPLLGDIPILGELFKSTDKTKQKTELLVFLTPRIVKDPDQARDMREKGTSDMSPETRRLLEKWWENKAKPGDQQKPAEIKKDPPKPAGKKGN